MSPPVPQPVNPSFELVGLQVAGTEPSLTGWTVFDGQLVQDSKHVHGEGQAGRWSATVLGGFAATNPVVPDFALGKLWGDFPEGDPFEPWATYTLTAWVYTESPCAAAMRFGYVPNGVEADCVTCAPVAVLANTWTPLHATWAPTWPYDGPQVQVSPYLPTPGAVLAVWLDDLLVTAVGR